MKNFFAVNKSLSVLGLLFSIVALTYGQQIFANSSESLMLLSLKGDNWKQRRDEGIVKQDKDFSCGAASLATLWNYYYGQNLT